MWRSVLIGQAQQRDVAALSGDVIDGTLCHGRLDLMRTALRGHVGLLGKLGKIQLTIG